MIPLYNGQENHYKKMLDLQEKLRKSEEERIRLEERFNLMVQESRNRHQACINRLRICYVDFLEEQKSRDERNNKLRGTLNKIDNSLILMSAKTERLNVLRKQYEAYLLRVYGNSRINGSVTADSGLESQNDQELSHSPILSKSIQTIPRSSFPWTNQESISNNYKLLPNSNENAENENAEKLNLLQKPVETKRNLNIKFSEPVSSSSPLEDFSDILRNRYILSSYLDNSWVSPNNPKADVRKNESSLRVASRKSLGESPLVEHDLDRCIGKIKRLHTDMSRGTEHNLERSFEEVDHEQNTSGDLLNISLSEDDPLLSTDDETKIAKSKLRGLRNFTRSSPIQNASDNLFNGQNTVHDSWPAALDKFTNSSVNSYISRARIVQDQLQMRSKDLIVEKHIDFDEAWRLIQQNRTLLATNDAVPAEVEKTQNLAKIDNTSDHEFKDDNDGCIEDDYDDTVDIDSWMPDDLEQQIQEVHVQDKIRDRPRRKLESIEEIDQPEDEEVKENEKSDLEEVHDSRFSVPNEVEEQKVEEIQSHTPGLSEINNRLEVENVNEESNNNGKYISNQQYYVQDNESQEYQKRSEYFHDYSQQLNENQQLYRYSDDPNQQYTYEVNAQYSGYENQPYDNSQYADYTNQQYQQYKSNQQYNLNEQYDPNQPYTPIEMYNFNQSHDPNLQYDQNHEYEHDSNPMYHQFISSGEYENYKDNQQHDQELNDEEVNQSNYDPNVGYDYSQETQMNDEISTSQPNDAYQNDNVVLDLSEEQTHSKDQTKDQVLDNQELSHISLEGSNKKKKDVIKSVLDSDSESFIERNLSNTESDFDFN